MTRAFMFATGVENSSPTINNGRTRIDEMEKCGHYETWRKDFDCVEELDIHFLRYGVPLYRAFLAPGKYDWEFAELTFGELRRRQILPICDMSHSGVPRRGTTAHSSPHSSPASKPMCPPGTKS